MEWSVPYIVGLFLYYRLFYLWEERMDLSFSPNIKSGSKRGDYYVEMNSGNFTR
jgi:hypothetical protein